MTERRAPRGVPSPLATGSLVQVIGVYDASTSLLGELAYWLRRVRGGGCSLCRVTHGHTGEREEWTRAAQRLPVPFVTYHRDDQPEDVGSAHAQCPAVLVRTTVGVEAILDSVAIGACRGDPGRLVREIQARLDERGFLTPPQ